MFYSVGPSVTDMKSGRDLYYRAEKMLFKLVGVQMGRHYRLPIAGEAGGTLTYRPDVQNGAESMLYLLAALGGQNIVGGLGSLHNANGMSAEQILMQCGLVDMAEYLHRGVDLSDQKLALDSIAAVGPGGNFLTDPLTLELLRSDEFFESRHLDLKRRLCPRGSPACMKWPTGEAERLVGRVPAGRPRKGSASDPRPLSPEVSRSGRGQPFSPLIAHRICVPLISVVAATLSRVE